METEEKLIKHPKSIFFFNVVTIQKFI